MALQLPHTTIHEVSLKASCCTARLNIRAGLGPWSYMRCPTFSPETINFGGCYRERQSPVQSNRAGRRIKPRPSYRRPPLLPAHVPRHREPKAGGWPNSGFIISCWAIRKLNLLSVTTFRPPNSGHIICQVSSERGILRASLLSSIPPTSK